MTDDTIPKSPAMEATPQAPSRRLLWLLGLLIMLVLPLWPAARMLFIAWRAAALQCMADHTLVCVDGGTDLGSSLQLAIEDAVNIGLLFMFAVAPWLLMCFVALRRLVPAFRLRLVVPALVTLFLAFVPYETPLHAFLLFDPDACLTNGFLVIQCELLGTDLRRHAEHLVTVLQWASWRAIAIAALTYAIYLIVQIIRHRRETRHVYV